VAVAFGVAEGFEAVGSTVGVGPDVAAGAVVDGRVVAVELVGAPEDAVGPLAVGLAVAGELVPAIRAAADPAAIDVPGVAAWARLVDNQQTRTASKAAQTAALDRHRSRGTPLSTTRWFVPARIHGQASSRLRMLSRRISARCARICPAADPVRN
jgi:hypothetical protein